MKRGNVKRMLSGFLATLTVLTSMVQPLMTFAAEPADSQIPFYEDVKDLLDVDEVVVGSGFDITRDFSGIEILDNEKVKVKFQNAMNDAGESFTTDHEDAYEAVKRKTGCGRYCCNCSKSGRNKGT